MCWADGTLQFKSPYLHILSDSLLKEVLPPLCEHPSKHVPTVLQWSSAVTLSVIGTFGRAGVRQRAMHFWMRQICC